MRAPGANCFRCFPGITFLNRKHRETLTSRFRFASLDTGFSTALIGPAKESKDIITARNTRARCGRFIRYGKSLRLDANHVCNLAWLCYAHVTFGLVGFCLLARKFALTF